MNDAHNWSSGNGAFHDDLAPAWNAVCAAHPLLIEHITGAGHHPAIELVHVVRAFHAASVTTVSPVRPDMLVAMFASYPDGAFASRALNGPDLMIKDVAAIWQQCVEAARAAREQAAEQASYLTISDEPWDPDTLAPRPWLAPPYLMRGEITLLHGPGGGGKSQLIVAWSVALALGKQFGRLKPRQRCRVLLTNLEDNAIEQMRRISATLQFFGATSADLKGWLYRVSLGPKGDATMFELDENGQVRTTSCWDALERACETIRADAVFGDPLVAINAVPENDNQLMRRVMTILRIGIAQRSKCALGVAHHDNKGGDDSDDADQGNARGAGDIVNAVRFELAVKKMASGQAEQMNIDRERRGFYFRLGSTASKLNYAAPEDSEWFERLAVVINGEQVVRCIPWQPPTGKIDDEQMMTLIAAIGRGIGGRPYSPQISNSDRAIGPLLASVGITAAKAQRRALHDLRDLHGVVQSAWKVPGRGDETRQGLRTAGGLPSNVTWCDFETDGEQG
jgi:hypothetical protein